MSNAENELIENEKSKSIPVTQSDNVNVTNNIEITPTPHASSNQQETDVGAKPAPDNTIIDDKSNKTSADPDPKSTQEGNEPANETVNKTEADQETTSKEEQDTATKIEQDSSPKTISIALSFIDPIGTGIAKLAYRIVTGNKTTEGMTDDKGNAVLLDGVAPEISLEILIKRDDGSWTSKYQGQTSCSDMNICAQSPYLKLKVTPEEHKGKEQSVVTPKPAPKQEIPKPRLPLAGQIKTTAPVSQVTAQTKRDDKGHPVAKVDSVSDWASRHLVPAWADHLYDRYKIWRKGEDQKNGSDKANANNIQAAPSASITSVDQAAPLAVTQLIAVMEEQSTWDWNNLYKVKRLNSGSIISGLLNKTLEPPTGKAPGESHGRCYPSVKVGLMRTNLAKNIWDDIPAKGAGKWLLSQGFVDVMKKVPDGRWAAPGDIIVYRYDDATEAANLVKFKKAFESYEVEKKAYPEVLKQWEAQHQERQSKLSAALAASSSKDAKGQKKEPTKLPKEATKPPEPKEPDADNWGHIDVRTYDGYISDFKTKILPRAAQLNGKKGFVVTGIYRKIYDPLPEIRVRAFLKLLREWENHGIADDSKRYFALYKTGKEQQYFTDTSKHPYEGVANVKNTPAGAYQFTLETYIDFTSPLKGIGAGFSAAQQDRLAIARIEIVNNGDVLAKIRNGEIALATTALNRVWSSLPGTKESRKEKRGDVVYTFTINDVVNKHKEFMHELIGK